MPKEQTKKEKKIKAWAILVDGKFWMYDTKLEDRLWARITRTRKQAKERYPDMKIIPIEIAYKI